MRDIVAAEGTVALVVGMTRIPTAEAVIVPFLQDALHTVPLRWSDWALIAALAAPDFIITEVAKWLRTRWPRLSIAG